MRAKPKLPDSFHHQKRGQCRWCGQPIIENGSVNRRKLWHSKCVYEYNIATDSGMAAAALVERDGEVCQSCKLDLGALRVAKGGVWGRLHRGRRHGETEDEFARDIAGVRVEFEKLQHQILALGFDIKYTYPDSPNMYQVDHKNPVWKSRGDIKFFELSNQWIMCVPCHARKTREDMVEYRAWRRSGQFQDRSQFETLVGGLKHPTPHLHD